MDENNEPDLYTCAQEDHACQQSKHFKSHSDEPEEPAVLGKIWTVLQKLEKQGLIRRSSSKWQFPAATIVKKNGNVQLCADYRQLNQKTLEKDNYQVYTSEMAQQAQNSIQAARYFSYFDLAFWYQQVSISEEDTEKTAFMTPFGLYEYLRIPFGLANAQGTLQHLVDSLFGHLQFRKYFVICDDFLLFSSDYDEHIKDVEELLDKIMKANLTLRPRSMIVGTTLEKYYQHMLKRTEEQEKLRYVKMGNTSYLTWC